MFFDVYQEEIAWTRTPTSTFVLQMVMISARRSPLVLSILALTASIESFLEPPSALAHEKPPTRKS